MIEHPPKEEFLSIIKEIEADSSATQRFLSVKLDISLGKTNYLLRELIKKGIIKAGDFSSKPGKLGKINYYLTKKGLQEKARLMGLFLKKKEADYFVIKKEFERFAADRVKNSAVLND
jgi:hypothetical protein